MNKYFTTNKNFRGFNPDLAVVLGVNEAIVLQQINYWIEIKESDAKRFEDSFKDGYMWVFNSFESWKEQFPFWSIITIKRAFASLEKMGVLVVGRYNKYGYDRTKWYRIDYQKVEEMAENQDSIKMIQSKVSNWYDGEYQNDTTNTKDYTENTTDTTFFNNGNFSDEEISPNPYIELKMVNFIKKICREEEYTDEQTRDAIDVITYYFREYKMQTGIQHPVINKRAQMLNIISAIVNGTDAMNKYDQEEDAEGWIDLIRHHFDTKYENCDYNINHFFSGQVAMNRIYEYHYRGNDEN